MVNENKPLVIIDPKTSDIPTVNPDCSLFSLITALNPIGIIGKSIVEIMAYRVEAKRLKSEEIRIKESSKVAQAYISANYKVKMKQIENQRLALIKGLNFAEQNLQNGCITRKALIASLENANAAMMNLVHRKYLPSEEIFEVFRFVIADIIEQLVILEKNNVEQASFINKHLLRIVGDTKQDLSLPPNV